MAAQHNVSRPVRRVAQFFLPRQQRSRPARLLKARVHGGLLILTDRELVLGEGWLGAANVRRFPLASLAHLELQPAAGQHALRRSMRLHFEWHDGRAACGSNRIQKMQTCTNRLAGCGTTQRHAANPGARAASFTLTNLYR